MLNLALNRISGQWDQTALSQLLQDLESVDADLALSGFTGDQINRTLAELELMPNPFERMDQGYVRSHAHDLDAQKLALRLEAVAHCQQRSRAPEPFSGTGR